VARFPCGAGLVAALAAAVLACHRAPQIDGVVVAEEATAPLGEAGIDGHLIEAGVRDALARAGFRLRAGSGRTYRARAEVRGLRIVPASDGLHAEVALEIELVPSGAEGEPVRETATGDALVSGAPEAAFRAALGEAARGAATSLALGFADERKGDGELVRELSSSDARVRDHALRTLASRRSADAVPAIIERLRDDDPQVAHRALAALAQIRDPRAVGALIELSRGGDAAVAARVARIIGDIGGQEAEGYLLTIEAGHPDPVVRRAAREALAEVRARAPSATAAARR
jgi:hypothetical protein